MILENDLDREANGRRNAVHESSLERMTKRVPLSYRLNLQTSELIAQVTLTLANEHIQIQPAEGVIWELAMRTLASDRKA